MALSANNKVSLTDLNALMVKIVTKARSCACNCNFCTCNCNYCACHTNVCLCVGQCSCVSNTCTCQADFPSECGTEGGN
jgi:hypothetical protein